MIELERVSKHYITGELEVVALRNIDLFVGAGEFVALVGPSGSGKSTLMNILGCLDVPTSGTYRLEGQDVAELDDDDLAWVRSRYIGFVFQSYNLVPRLRAARQVELPLLYQGASGRKERVEEALRSVGMLDWADHLPTQLSAGQQQRIAIARALVSRPSLILADEPTGALDSATSAEVMDLFERLNQELGITVIVVTHEPTVAARARRIITLRDGQVIADEPSRGKNHAYP